MLDSANPRASSRTDGKASLLRAFNGAVLAGLASLADRDLTPATKAFAAAAVLALGGRRAAAPGRPAPPAR
ncbi:hypothetical protein ACWC09_46975 [Streptomyces sp. NPDC001617]